MKKSIARTMLCIAAALWLLWLPSCNHNDEPFSCTPEVDNWVKENLSEVQTMTRSEWLELNDPETERACFRAFTPEQRLQFWVDKLNETLTLDWSVPEKEHISSLIKFIEDNPRIFSDYANEMDLQELTDKFLYLWIEEGQENFKWTLNTIYAIVASGHTLMKENDTYYIRDYAEGFLTRGGNDCGCSSSDDWCRGRALDINMQMPITIDGPYDLEKTRCVKGDCNVGSIGCGTLFLGKCDGNCDMVVIKP